MKSALPTNSSANTSATIKDSAFRRALHQRLKNLQDAQLTITDPLGEITVGQPGQDALHAHIQIDHIDTYRDIALGGSNGAAEAYLQEKWHTANLTNVIRVMARNRELLDAMEGGLARVAGWALRLWHRRNKNSRQGSRKNIAAHYDLGNEFFRLFLDKRMMYSSYLYHKGDDLHTASTRKLQRICEQLRIKQSDHILEIGSGWGGFAIYAAQTTGCRVTTITISKEQYNESLAQIEKNKLQEFIKVELMDYRDLKGQFDKVVSIEMIEAVGHHYLDTYFATIARVLKPKGQALLQAITVEDHRYQQSLKEVDFIKRYIFPGSFIPCINAIGQSASNSKLVIEDIHDIGLSYARTLADWRQRFFEQIETVRAQGFDERFIRMWEFYLCYCEGGFAERAISDVQIHFRKS